MVYYSLANYHDVQELEGAPNNNVDNINFERIIDFSKYRESNYKVGWCYLFVYTLVEVIFITYILVGTYFDMNMLMIYITTIPFLLGLFIHNIYMCYALYKNTTTLLRNMSSSRVLKIYVKHMLCIGYAHLFHTLIYNTFIVLLCLMVKDNNNYIMYVICSIVIILHTSGLIFTTAYEKKYFEQFCIVALQIINPI